MTSPSRTAHSGDASRRHATFSVPPVVAQPKTNAKGAKSSPTKLPSVLKRSPSPEPTVCAKDTVVQFLLINADDLDTMDDRDTCDPYVVFTLGAEKYTSRVRRRTIFKSA